MAVNPNVGQADWDTLMSARGNPATDMIVVVDGEFRLRAGSPAAMAALGWNYDDSEGRLATELIHPDDALRALGSFDATLSHPGARPPDVFRLRHRDGTYLEFDVSGETLVDPEPAVVFLLRRSEDRDPAEELALENVAVIECLGASTDLVTPLELVVEMTERHIHRSAVVLFTTDQDGAPLSLASDHVPASIADYLEARLDDEDSPMADCHRRGVTIVETDVGARDFWEPVRDTLGEAGYRSVAASPVVDPRGRPTGSVVVFRRSSVAPSHREYSIHSLAKRLVGLIADWHRRRARLIAAAGEDPLTQLGNRRGLTDRLERVDASGRTVSIGVLDLDEFSKLNNDHGHDAGDRVLRRIGDRVASALPEGARVYRAGGDEFTIVLSRAAHPALLASIGSRLLAEIRRPIPMTGGPVRVTGSLGWATSDGRSAGDTVKAADDAMYRAKRAGGDLTEVDEAAS